MCNCKGFDIIETEKEIYIEPHFCRVYGDCGSVDRTYDEVRQEVINDLYDSIVYLEKELLLDDEPDSAYSNYIVERILDKENILEKLLKEVRDGN